MSALAGQATGGVLWSTAQKWAVRVTGFVTLAVLTRMLTASDFGVVAVATAVMPLIYLLSDLGFATYVVQAEKTDRRLLSTAFWYSTAAGIALAGILALSAPLLGVLFHLAAVVPVLIAFAPVVIAVSVGSVPTAILRRRMAFRALAVQTLVASIIGQVVALAMALTGAGIWALVGQLIAVQVITTGWAWVASRWKPSFAFSTEDFRRMSRFGANIVGTEIAALARLWAETAIIAAVLGPAGLGYFNIAQRLIQTAQDLTASAVIPVSTVVFARVRDDMRRLGVGYRKASELTYAAIVPAMILITVCAAQIIPLLFGPQWIPSVTAAQGLAVAGILTLGATLDQALFYGMGRPGTWFVYGIGIEALTVTGTVVAAAHGLGAVAIAFVAVALVATAVRWVLVARLAGASYLSCVVPFARIALAAAVSAAAGIAVRQTALSVLHVPDLLVIVLVGVTIVLVHASLVRLVAPAVFTTVWSLLPSRLKRPSFVPTQIAEELHS